jgi:DNA-binding CsgD family transcriptional regulator
MIIAPLSPRQAEIFKLIDEGLTSKDIARKLGISPRTVDQHIAFIRAKYGVKSRKNLRKIA